MDLHDQVPVRILHVLEADVAQNTGIVDEDIDPAESLDGSVDNGLTILHGVVVCYSFSSCGLDLVDDNIGSLGIVVSFATESPETICD